MAMADALDAETTGPPASSASGCFNTGAPVAASKPSRKPSPSTVYTTPLATDTALYVVTPLRTPTHLGNALVPSSRKSCPGGPAAVYTAPPVVAGDAALHARHGMPTICWA